MHSGTRHRSSPAPILEPLAFWLLAALVVWAPIPLGSNRPWAWAVLELGLFSCGLLWLGAYARREVSTTPAFLAARPALAILALWLAYLVVQWVPMPVAWVKALSPNAASLHAEAHYLSPAGRYITLSVDPHASMDFWLRSLAFAVAFALVLLVADTRRRMVILCGAFVVTGVLQAFVAGILHLGGLNMEVLGMPISHAAQASGTYVSRNHLAGLLEMTLAVGIGLMLAQLEDRPHRTLRQFVQDTAELLLSGKAMLRLMLIIMVSALVMTRSRMGNTAFLASLLVAGALALVLSRRAPRSTMVFIASLLVVDIAIVGAWFGVERTVQRIVESSAQSFAEKGDVIEEALRMVADYPLVGTGAGTFYAVFPHYRGAGVTVFYDHLHNDYLQFLVETGPLGFGLMGLLVVASLGCALLALVRRRDPVARGVAFGAVMGIVAIGIHSFVDFNLQIPANAFLFTLLLAMGWLSLFLESPRRPS